MILRSEQETTMTMMRDDSFAVIYTSNRVHVRRLRKYAAAEDFITEIRGGDDWAEFRIDSENFKPLLAIRRKRAVSAAQRAAAREAGLRLAGRRGSVAS